MFLPTQSWNKSVAPYICPSSFSLFNLNRVLYHLSRAQLLTHYSQGFFFTVSWYIDWYPKFVPMIKFYINFWFLVFYVNRKTRNKLIIWWVQISCQLDIWSSSCRSIVKNVKTFFCFGIIYIYTAYHAIEIS